MGLAVQLGDDGCLRRSSTTRRVTEFGYIWVRRRCGRVLTDSLHAHTARQLECRSRHCIAHPGPQRLGATRFMCSEVLLRRVPPDRHDSRSVCFRIDDGSSG